MHRTERQLVAREKGQRLAGGVPAHLGGARGGAKSDRRAASKIDGPIVTAWVGVRESDLDGRRGYRLGLCAGIGEGRPAVRRCGKRGSGDLWAGGGRSVGRAAGRLADSAS